VAPHLGATDDPALPLPAWDPNDMIRLNQEPEAIPLGGLLWPDGFNPDSLLPPETSPARMPPDTLLGDGSTGLLSSKPREGFLLFIPKPRPVASGKPAPIVTPPQQLVDVSHDFIQRCESAEPEAPLLDPHTLLTETESEDLRRLLTYHAGESGTFAHFLLLDSDEQLPATADVTRMAGGKLAQDHACLTVYPIAEPWRARIFMTREITERVPTDYLRGILQACVQDAMQASDPVQQLQRFATQLSIRLIWMERAYPDIFVTLDQPVVADLSATPAPTPPPTLAEVTAAPTPVSTGVHPLFPHWRQITVVAGSALAGLLVLFLTFRIVRRWRRRRMRNSVWILPEVEVKPRFDAPHCGQGGVWIRYG
jgi:hypothetical protein